MQRFKQPLVEAVVAAAFAFGIGALIAIWLWVEFTGYRVVTYIGIRAEGLVWERAHFYPRNHIWEICYGITQKHRETGEERYLPKIEIQVGVHVLVLAEDLEPMPAELFEHLFRQDTRRYWHGHN